MIFTHQSDLQEHIFSQDMFSMNTRSFPILMKIDMLNNMNTEGLKYPISEMNGIYKLFILAFFMKYIRF